MTGRNTVARSLHDVGLAAWFGGALMGASALNAGAGNVADPRERLRTANTAWQVWSPFQGTAIAAHAVGGLGLLRGNKARLVAHPEARRLTAVKTAVTGVAFATTYAASRLGAEVERLGRDDGVGRPDEALPYAKPELATAQRRLKVVQAVNPLLTGALIVMGALEGEQQRPAAGLLKGRHRR